MPTADFVQKLSEMREIIEPAAAASAANHRNATQLKRMQVAFDAMEAAHDPEAWTTADIDFHEAILAATGNELLVSLFSVVETALSSLSTGAASLGAAKSRIDTQKSFLSNLSDSIDKGVGSLVDADMNKESTRLQALQVQQQLGIQALSIANGNSQSILSLFR